MFLVKPWIILDRSSKNMTEDATFVYMRASACLCVEEWLLCRDFIFLWGYMETGANVDVPTVKQPVQSNKEGLLIWEKAKNITTLRLSWPDLIVWNEEILKNVCVYGHLKKKYSSSFTLRVWQHWWMPDLDQVPALGCRWQPVCHLVVRFGALAPRGHPQCCCQTHISLRRVWSHHLTPWLSGLYANPSSSAQAHGTQTLWLLVNSVKSLIIPSKSIVNAGLIITFTGKHLLLWFTGWQRHSLCFGTVKVINRTSVANVLC